MDRLQAAWRTLQIATNNELPGASGQLHAMISAYQNAPSPGGGGGTGGGGNGGSGGVVNAVTDAVINAAKAELGKSYKLGAEGPNVFDCSGLVDWAFRTTRNYELIGSARRTAAGYAHWFDQRGHFTRDLSQRARGDLMCYWEKGGIGHIGIMLSGDRVISALVNPWGVAITSWNHLSVSPYGVCKVQWPGAAVAAFQAASVVATAPESTSVFLATDGAESLG